MLEIINLTPHPLRLVRSDGTDEVFPSAGIARVSETARILGFLGGLPVKAIHHHDLEGLPEPSPDKIIVVSTICAHAAWKVGRTDVVCPTDFSRDEYGRIKGCRAFCGNPDASGSWPNGGHK